MMAAVSVLLISQEEKHVWADEAVLILRTANKTDAHTKTRTRWEDKGGEKKTLQ